MAGDNHLDWHEQNQNSVQDRENLRGQIYAEAQNEQQEQVPHWLQVQREEEALAKQLHEQTLIQKQEREARATKLKAGSLPVSSFYDAMLKYDPKEFLEYMQSPLLQADGRIYAVKAFVDAEENGQIRIRNGGYSLPFVGWIELGYATMIINNKTKNFAKRAMRINSEIVIIGRYVQNIKFLTVKGQTKIMPVIEVMYLDDAKS